MTRVSGEPCAWCGLESDRQMLVEPQMVRKTGKGTVVIQPDLMAPCCELCADSIVRLTPQMRAARIGAWSRYWQRRQERLI